MKITITISKSFNGLMDYVQIMSEDMVSINIVLLAEEILVEDHRNKEVSDEKI